MMRDRRGAELVNELQTRVHSREILERKRDELEATRVVSPGEIVVDEAPEIITSLHCHPADDVRLELGDEIASHVDESGAPWREKPLLRAAGEHVDVGRANVER